MVTTVVRAVCVLIGLAFLAGVGSVTLAAHRRGLARLHTWRVRQVRLDPHAQWISALGREVRR